MPTLLQLNSAANWGSTGKIAEGIGVAAMKRGWQSYVAYGRGEYMNPSESQLIMAGSRAETYLHYAHHRLLDGEGWGSAAATRRLINRMRVLRPDIVHLHNIHDHWLNYPLLFDYLAAERMPVVWTLHDCWPFTGGCAYFDSPACDRWKHGCGKCPQRAHIDRTARHFELRRRFFRSMGRRLTAVAVSDWLADFCRESALADCRITMIHNGIDISRFSPAAPKADKPLILGVALPWSERKGLPAMLRLRELLPADKVDITLVGLSPSQISELPAGITGIERTQDQRELARLYSSAHVFVNPTLSDNFPTVNLEAMACGTPVVTYRTGGSPEAVDSRTGIVVSQGDTEALARAALTVIDNPGHFAAGACRARAEAEFDKDRQFAKYIDLYESSL